jgi:hypothetical protein
MQRPATFLYFWSNFHKYIQILSCGCRPQVILIFVFSAIDVLISTLLVLLVIVDMAGLSHLEGESP